MQSWQTERGRFGVAVGVGVGEVAARYEVEG